MLELTPSHEAAPLAEVADEGMYDKNDPKSLYNLLPPSMQEHLLRTRNSFLTDLSTESIRKNIKNTAEYNLVQKVRVSFWREYDDAQSTGRKMRMTRVWQGVCENSSHFFNLMKKDHFSAFVFTKPISKDVRERVLLNYAYEQIEDILLAQHYNKDGSLNPHIAKIKVDIFKHMDERVHGGALKRVAVQSEQKNYNVNVETTGKEFIEMKKAEELTQRLAELREQTQDLEVIETSSRLVDDDDI